MRIVIIGSLLGSIFVAIVTSDKDFEMEKAKYMRAVVRDDNNKEPSQPAKIH